MDGSVSAGIHGSAACCRPPKTVLTENLPLTYDSAAPQSVSCRPTMSSEQRQPATEKRLSPQAAFVVQFVAGSDLRGGAVSGRVEHVATGRNARFASVDELLRFIADILTHPAAEDSN